MEYLSFFFFLLPFPTWVRSLEWLGSQDLASWELYKIVRGTRTQESNVPQLPQATVSTEGDAAVPARFSNREHTPHPH